MLFEGTVVDVVRNGTVAELSSGHKLRAVLAGKLRLHAIRVTVGDRVKVQV